MEDTFKLVYHVWKCLCLVYVNLVFTSKCKYIITFENASILLLLITNLPFASIANSKWKDFLFTKMSTIYDRIRHEGWYIISISRLNMPLFVFCNWLPICHLKDPFEASEWKSLETRFVQYDEYYTRDMIWWYMKNLSHLVERSIISVSL